MKIKPSTENMPETTNKSNFLLPSPLASIH